MRGFCIGEAVNPGPACLDDPEIQFEDEDVNDDWHDEPPVEATFAAGPTCQEPEVVAFIKAAKFPKLGQRGWSTCADLLQTSW